MLCLTNKVSRKLFVYGDEGPGTEQVRLIVPDGRILTLNRELFEEETLVPLSELSEAQRLGFERLEKEQEKAARASLRRSAAGVSYTASRLTFYRDIIEPLSPGQSFTIVCRDGSFTLTKAEFHAEFSNVAQSLSYRVQGNYNYSQTPTRAYDFLTNRRR